jgi:tRNA(adenine34) deaminase
VEDSGAMARECEWMAQALDEARRAAEEGDVPVGAVVVVRGEIIARAHNRREADRDPTAHAELAALRDAAATLGRWRLHGAELYTTLEPCPMCAGAMIAARIDRVVFGARDPKAGACGSVVDLFSPGRFNHRPSVVGDVLGEPCGLVLREFFARRRGHNDQKTRAPSALENAPTGP